MLELKSVTIHLLSSKQVQKKGLVEFVAFLLLMALCQCSTLIYYRKWKISSVRQVLMPIRILIFKQAHLAKKQTVHLLMQVILLKNAFSTSVTTGFALFTVFLIYKKVLETFLITRNSLTSDFRYSQLCFGNVTFTGIYRTLNI
jgi:hypothetical protein